MHDADRPKTDYGLTSQLDHPMGAVQKLKNGATMKKSLMLVASLIALPVMGHADEIAAPSNWAGPYVGITAGTVSGSADFGPTGVLNISSPYQTGTLDLSGGAYGVQIGYNFEVGNKMVVGIVADYSSLSVDGVHCVEYSTGVCDSGLDSKLNGEVSSLLTARLNIGFDLGKSLFYVTGGRASAETTGSINDIGITAIDYVDVSDTKTMLGVVTGVGVNFKVAENVLIGAEYLHVNFTDTQFDYSADILEAANTGGGYASTDLNLLRVSLNYRF